MFLDIVNSLFFYPLARPGKTLDWAATSDTYYGADEVAVDNRAAIESNGKDQDSSACMITEDFSSIIKSTYGTVEGEERKPDYSERTKMVNGGGKHGANHKLAKSLSKISALAGGNYW